MADARRAYRAAGVDVDAGSRAVDLIRAHVESTRRVEVLGGLGGFGGAFTVPAGYREPVLVASTDGVGTKTAIAAGVGRFDTIGIDLVAMCVDDVACTGAEPLAFLDYVAVGELDPVAVAELVSGVAAGCREAGCALVGGETAEHPGLMAAGAFDLAGTAIGVVERSRMIDGSAVRAGDAIIGLASSGLHSNGYSLVRALVTEWELNLAEPYQARLRRTLGDVATDEALRAGPARGDGDARRDAADPDPDLRPGAAPGPRGARRARLGPPRPGPHHGRRAAGQRAARPARRPRSTRRPGALGDAVGHAPGRGAGRDGRRRGAGHVQRWDRDDRGRAAGRRFGATIAGFAGDDIEAIAGSARSSTTDALGGARYVEAPLEGAG